MKTSMKTLMDRFTKAPYGFIEDDVEWLTDSCMNLSKLRLELNPKPLGREEVSAIYREVM